MSKYKTLSDVLGKGVTDQTLKKAMAAARMAQPSVSFDAVHDALEATFIAFVEDILPRVWDDGWNAGALDAANNPPKPAKNPYRD